MNISVSAMGAVERLAGWWEGKRGMKRYLGGSRLVDLLFGLVNFLS